jgi:hypothetical protein
LARNVAATAQNVKNQYVSPFDPVDDYELSHGKTAQACAQIVIAPTPDLRVRRE